MNNGDLAGQLVEIEKLIAEEILIAAGNADDLRIQSHRAGHRDKEPRDLIAVAAVLAQQVIDAFVVLVVFFPGFFGGTIPLVSKVIQLLHSCIQFAQLLLGVIGGKHKLAGSSFCIGVPSHELLRVFAPVNAGAVPEFFGVSEIRAGIVEAHAHLQLVLRRGQLFGLKCWNVVELQLDALTLVLQLCGTR